MLTPVVVVPGTFWNDTPEWAATYALANQPMQAVARIFGSTPRLFEWSGGNSAKERHAAAQELALQLADWPEAHLFGFSHGGNVAAEAAALVSRAKGPVIDLLVTVATPFTGNYQTAGARRHLHFYSPTDRMQVLGGEGPLGMPSFAQRTFPGATNIAIEGIASSNITGSHGNILWSEQTWAKLLEHVLAAR